MEKILKVVALTNEREFDSTENGKNVKVKAVDIEMTDGMNTFIVGAAGRAADAVMKSGITAGTLINADLRFSTKEVKTEAGRTFLQQRVSLSDFGIIGQS